MLVNIFVSQTIAMPVFRRYEWLATAAARHEAGGSGAACGALERARLPDEHAGAGHMAHARPRAAAAAAAAAARLEGGAGGELTALGARTQAQAARRRGGRAQRVRAARARPGALEQICRCSL